MYEAMNITRAALAGGIVLWFHLDLPPLRSRLQWALGEVWRQAQTQSLGSPPPLLVDWDSGGEEREEGVYQGGEQSGLSVWVALATPWRVPLPGQARGQGRESAV